MAALTDTFTFTDEIPEPGNPVVSSDLACETCGAPLVYSGRGRKPRYCDEHRKSPKATRGARSSGPVVERAISELKMVYAYGGQALKFKYPDVGERIFQQSDKLAESYRLLLESNARFRKLFTQLESKAAWLPIVAAHADIATAIWFEHKLQRAARNDENNSTENDRNVYADTI